MRPIAEWRAPDRATFENEVRPRYQPAVLRGLVAHWPAVRWARESDAALCRCLTELDNGSEVDALLVAPQHRGRIFYADDWNGFNFLRNRLPLSKVLEQVQRYAHFDAPPAVAVQSAPLDACAPGFAETHALPLLDAAVRPRLWLGNAIITPTHFDESNNIACVVAGERQFTLFPPEQIANLYVGPIGNAPTGTPISLVDLDAPDLERFPRFEAALATAQRALLEPGDAIYIPALWWHHVASRKRLNMLVNYWWGREATGSGFDVLLHALLALRSAPPVQREAWRALFDYWLFRADADSVAHIAPALRGVHADMTDALAAQIRALLRAKLGA